MNRCSCGMRFRSMYTEARHRHNFPALCRKPKPKKDKRDVVAHEGHTGLNTQSTKKRMES